MGELMIYVEDLNTYISVYDYAEEMISISRNKLSNIEKVSRKLDYLKECKLAIENEWEKTRKDSKISDESVSEFKRQALEYIDFLKKTENEINYLNNKRIKKRRKYEKKISIIETENISELFEILKTINDSEFIKTEERYDPKEFLMTLFDQQKPFDWKASLSKFIAILEVLSEDGYIAIPKRGRYDLLASCLESGSQLTHKGIKFKRVSSRRSSSRETINSYKRQISNICTIPPKKYSAI